MKYVLLWTDALRKDVTAARKETEQAVQQVTDYKQTVALLECDLSSAHDVERLLSNQV